MPTAFLQNRLIPLPPLAEQRRIVDILDRAAAIQRLRKAAEEKAREIIPALFVDMFGDPATNPKGWPVVTLGGLLIDSPRNGLSPARLGTHRDSVLTLSAITRGAFDATAVKHASFARPVANRERVTTSDFLITRGNGNLGLVGAGAMPNCDMPNVAFPDTMIAVRPDQQQIRGEYMEAYWKTGHMRRYLAASPSYSSHSWDSETGMV